MAVKLQTGFFVKVGPAGALAYLYVTIFLGLFAVFAHAGNDKTPAPDSRAMENFAAMPGVVPIPPPRAATKLAADTQDIIWFNSSSPFDFDILLHHFDKAEPTSTMAYLYLPPAATAKKPVPAMVFLPGSGGIRLGRQMILAEFLVQNGYAVAVVDYYLSRGIDIYSVPYSTMVSNVTEFDVVTDAYAALNALQQHPAIDGKSIGVMGFSYGGMATRLAMDERLHKRLARRGARFAAHIDFYGPCFQEFNTEKTTGAPLLTLRGADDSSNELVACVMQEERLRAAGSAVGAVTYATAGHAWEGLRPKTMTTAPHVRGCTMEYDEGGIPSVRGQPLLDASAPVDRATRYRLRAASGRYFKDCLVAGYYVGRHAEAHEDSKHQMLKFLQKHL